MKRLLGLKSHKTFLFKEINVILLVVISFTLSSEVYSQSCWPPATASTSCDAPVSNYATHTGNLAVATGGQSFYPTLSSASFSFNLPDCSGNPPVIRAAYLNWFSRAVWFSNPGGTPGAITPDETLMLNLNNSGVSAVSQDDIFWGNNVRTSNGAYMGEYAHMVADITSELTGVVNVGLNTVDISDFSIPTAVGADWLQNFGVGIVVIYECSNIPYARVVYSAGNDFFWEGSNQGEYSDAFCVNFPASPNPRSVTLDAVFGGQESSAAPFRGHTLHYLTGESTTTPAPASPQNVYPTMPSVATAPAAIEVLPSGGIWVSSLGTEWDISHESILVPANHDYVCIQARSVAMALSGISGNMLAPVFTIPIDPASNCPPATRCGTVSSVKN